VLSEILSQISVWEAAIGVPHVDGAVGLGMMLKLPQRAETTAMQASWWRKLRRAHIQQASL